jgi:signal transduction histidine kinase
MQPATPDFRLLFEESPDVLLVLLPDSPRFTAVAATKARLSATHSILEDTVGRGLFELFPDNPDDLSANGTSNLRESLERVLSTKAADTMAVQKYDIPLPGGGFEVKWWSPRNLPVLSEHGEVLYILHRAEDVTDLVRAGEIGKELRGRTQDMEREVLRRSAELDAANRELREANQKLSRLDAAKTAFFNNISHEFRTPLTLMLGPLADALSDVSLNQEQRGRIQLAYDNSLRLLKLVNALLDFARLEAGRLRGNYAPLDFAALTTELAQMFQPAVDAAGVKLRLDCAPLSQPIWIDRDMWEKVVPNLISNAFKFTLQGEIRVAAHESPTHAVLEVSDTGIGIPEKELPKIFERFHRVSSTGRTHEGAGIGLALVRELVELHGGTIAATSTLGSGSTFRVEIPKGCAHLPSDSLEHPAPTAMAVSTPAHAVEAGRWSALSPVAAEGRLAERVPAERAPHAARILIVDDNADLRGYMRDLLQPHYQVTTANDGVAALHATKDSAPDLILSDVMMPNMTGLELVRALRADPQTVAIPVILLSARAGEEATVDGLDSGADDYLTKPFTAAELLARVRAHVALAAARRKWAVELQNANLDLDAFSSSVAHDLRAPLRLIEGFGLMLAEENGAQLDAEGRRRLEMVRGSAKRMSQLIDDLLYLARLTRGNLRRMTLDLAMLVRTAAARLQSANPDRRVNLNLPQEILADADVALINILIENLVGNAWKFTSRRLEARIEVGVTSQQGERTYFIRDNGAGFNMAYASKLFGAFQRLHSDAEFQGTGIGLATVSRIVNKHGGRIWAVSEVDQGATFYFTLGPQDLAAAAEGAEAAIALRA